jgi:hypothetical protein
MRLIGGYGFDEEMTEVPRLGWEATVWEATGSKVTRPDATASDAGLTAKLQEQVPSLSSGERAKEPGKEEGLQLLAQLLRWLVPEMAVEFKAQEQGLNPPSAERPIGLELPQDMDTASPDTTDPDGTNLEGHSPTRPDPWPGAVPYEDLQDA